MFAAQPLANLDIFVLQVEDKVTENVVHTPAEAEMYMYMGGYEAAIETLTWSKLVDREKIGLAGFSRTGWHVEYALTRSKVHYAAAVVCRAAIRTQVICGRPPSHGQPSIAGYW